MGCEILIYRNPRRYYDRDSEKNKRGVYKKGYIVSVRQMPHNGWSNEELFPAGNFVIIRITDTDMDAIIPYTYPLFDENDEIILKRKYILKSNLTSEAEDYSENNNGDFLEIDYEKFLKNIKENE